MTGGADNQVELFPAARSDAPLVRALLGPYVLELSGYRDRGDEVGNVGTYFHLDAYWSEPGRFPFLIRLGDRCVGFALVRGPGSTGTEAHQMAEFYVEPQNRRTGVGLGAVLTLWNRFPGLWDWQVVWKNQTAVAFWNRCVELATGAPAEVRQVEASDGRRFQYSVRV